MHECIIWSFDCRKTQVILLSFLLDHQPVDLQENADTGADDPAFRTYTCRSDLAHRTTGTVNRNSVTKLWIKKLVTIILSLAQALQGGDIPLGQGDIRST